DTLLPAEAPAVVRQALADAGVAGGRFDVRFDNPGRAFRVIAAFMNWRSRLTGIATGDQAIFVRRSVFEAGGGYPLLPLVEGIALMEDIELCRRLRRRGRLACVRQVVTTSARKWEREGVARTVLLMWTLRFLYFCGVDANRLHTWYYGRPSALERR